MDIFSIMPIEAFMDDRLTKTDLRVLGAILSWRNKNTNLMWPKREKIAERCNLPLCKISTSTTHLVALNWLEKEGDGGRSRSSQYKLTVPDILIKTLTDSVTVTESVTVTKQVTETLTDSVTKTVTDSVRGIKHKEEQKEEQKVTLVDNTDSAKKEAKQVKAKIKADWMPSDRCYELAFKAGIERSFVNGLIDEFILYWDERGDKRNGWDAAFLGHAKRENERNKRFGYKPNNNQAQPKPAPQYIPPEQRNAGGLIIDSTARKL